MPLQTFNLTPPRPRVIKVIESEGRTGCGHSDQRPCPMDHEHEPMRVVVLYHTLGGELLALRDDWQEQRNPRFFSLPVAKP